MQNQERSVYHHDKCGFNIVRVGRNGSQLFFSVLSVTDELLCMSSRLFPNHELFICLFFQKFPLPLFIETVHIVFLILFHSSLKQEIGHLNYKHISVFRTSILFFVYKILYLGLRSRNAFQE